MADSVGMLKDADFDAVIEIGPRAEGDNEVVDCSSCAYQDRIAIEGLKKPPEQGLYKMLRTRIRDKEKTYHLCPAFAQEEHQDIDEYCETIDLFPTAYSEPSEESGRIPHSIDFLVDEIRDALRDNFDAIQYLSRIDFLDSPEVVESDFPYKIEMEDKSLPTIPKIRIKINVNDNSVRCPWMSGRLTGEIETDLEGKGYKPHMRETEEAVYIDFIPTEEMEKRLKEGLEKEWFKDEVRDHVNHFL